MPSSRTSSWTRLESARDAAQDAIRRAIVVADQYVQGFPVTDEFLGAIVQFDKELERCTDRDEVKRRAETTKSRTGEETAYAEAIEAVRLAGLEDLLPFAAIKWGVPKHSNSRWIRDELAAVRAWLGPLGKREFAQSQRAALVRWERELALIEEEAHKNHEAGCQWLMYFRGASERIMDPDTLGRIHHLDPTQAAIAQQSCDGIALAIGRETLVEIGETIDSLYEWARDAEALTAIITKEDLTVSRQRSSGEALLPDTNLPFSEQVGAGDQVDDDAFLGPATLAEKFGVAADPLRSRLNRWRKNNPSEAGKGFVENKDRNPKEPLWLYKVGSVRHLIEGLVATSQTTSERPAKKN